MTELTDSMIAAARRRCVESSRKQGRNYVRVLCGGCRLTSTLLAINEAERLIDYGWRCADCQKQPEARA